MKEEVVYKFGTDAALGPNWDAMQVIYRADGRIENSFVIARDGTGKIIRRTDLVLDRWEVINDSDDLKGFQYLFGERDRLATVVDPCTCNHPLSVHTRDIRETNAMRLDDALLPSRGYDITTDKPAGTSGCAECDCRHWERALTKMAE